MNRTLWVKRVGAVSVAGLLALTGCGSNGIGPVANPNSPPGPMRGSAAASLGGQAGSGESVSTSPGTDPLNPNPKPRPPLNNADVGDPAGSGANPK